MIAKFILIMCQASQVRVRLVGWITSSLTLNYVPLEPILRNKVQTKYLACTQIGILCYLLVLVMPYLSVGLLKLPIIIDSILSKYIF